ncbi:hypothetical protein Tco_0406117 [Tanacetum coccineum]
MGNGVDIRFWEDKWRGDNTFQSDFPRISKSCAEAEELQYIQLVKIMEGITLFDSKDRWRWSLEGCGEFTVASVRNRILSDWRQYLL